MDCEEDAANILSQGLHPWLVSTAPPGLPPTSCSMGVLTERYAARSISDVPQSLGQIYLHTVFATKNREPLIITPAPARLHGYLVAVLSELGCPSLATGGIADHVHILHSLGRTNSVAWVMEKLKSNSSRWMKEHGAADFWWQPGYATFSVGRSELERVKRYIHGQPDHHREHSFEQELRALCDREPADTAALEEFLRQEPRRGGPH